MSSGSAIHCFHKIETGSDIQVSWNCLIMDSDAHSIYGLDDKKLNYPQEIILGDHVWVGCDCTILKGVHIPNGCIIGAKSLVVNGNFEENTIIAGHPARTIKKIKAWKL